MSATVWVVYRRHRARHHAPLLYIPSCTQEVQTMMTKVVRYVLFKQHQHPHVPIQRKEIIGVINAGSRHRVAAYILALAQAHVAGIFGIHMQEITRKTKAGPFDIHAGRCVLCGRKTCIIRHNHPKNTQWETRRLLC